MYSKSRFGVAPAGTRRLFGQMATLVHESSILKGPYLFDQGYMQIHREVG